jgi:hypothetical protein
MNAIEVQHHLGRARDFLEGMRLLQEDKRTFALSSALLGIHCAISYGDALRKGLGRVKLSADDHRSAATDLKKLLASGKFASSEGPDRLGKLISRKSRISYKAVEVRMEEVEEIVKHAERFALWAEGAGKELRIEGWRND